MKTITHTILVLTTLFIISCGETNTNTTDTTMADTTTATVAISETKDTTTLVVEKPSILDTINENLETKTQELESIINNL